MKKLVVLIMCLSVVSLSACKTTETNKAKSEITTTTSSETSAETTTEATTTAVTTTVAATTAVATTAAVTATTVATPAPATTVAAAKAPAKAVAPVTTKKAAPVVTTTAAPVTTVTTAAPVTTICENGYNSKNYAISILSHSMSKDYLGKPVLIVEYQYTNNAKKAVPFFMACHAKAYQYGVECSNVVICDDVDFEMVSNEVKPGVTYKLKVGYQLVDATAPVEVEVNDFLNSSTFAKQTINLQ